MKQQTFPRIRVSDSGIHGRGVYASEPIKKGARIIEYVGEKVSSEEGTRRGNLDPILTYVFVLNDKFDIDGNIGGNDSRFINHSCDPNCSTEVVDDRAFIYAIKDIASDEELCFDYSFDPDEEPVQCRCGKENCRGYLNVYSSQEEKKRKIAEFSKKENPH